MKDINNYFDKIFIINLDKRTDRWQECLNQFEKHNITNFERFSAVDGSIINNISKLLPGEYACILSHINVVKLAKERKYKRVLILEDDAELHDDFSEMFKEYVKQVPDNYDMLYLGGNHQGGFQMINTNLAIIPHTFALHAYSVQEHLYDTLISLGENNINLAIDVTFTHPQKVGNSYVFRPHLAWQRNSFSDIQGGVVYYDFLKN